MTSVDRHYVIRNLILNFFLIQKEIKALLCYLKVANVIKLFEATTLWVKLSCEAKLWNMDSQSHIGVTSTINYEIVHFVKWSMSKLGQFQTETSRQKFKGNELNLDFVEALTAIWVNLGM